MYYTLSPPMCILKAILTNNFIASSIILALYSKALYNFYSYYSIN